MERVTKVWKVPGAVGHRQRDSFSPSDEWENKRNGKINILSFYRSDITGTNDYSLVEITADTNEECETEFEAQLYDGAFECCNVGKIEVIEKIYVADRETGTFIEEVNSINAGLKLIAQYEESDKKEGTFEENFYSIVDGEHMSLI